MIKIYSPAAVEDALRRQAAHTGVPLSQYLAPFLKLIADGQLTLSPRLEPQASTPSTPAR